jgi:hypothetical protein
MSKRLNIIAQTDLKNACLDEQQDKEYLAEIALWDVCVNDGLSDEG